MISKPIRRWKICYGNGYRVKNGRRGAHFLQIAYTTCSHFLFIFISRMIKGKCLEQEEMVLKNWMKGHKVLVVVLVALVVIAIAGIFIVPRILGNGKEAVRETKQNTVNLSKMDLTSSVSATGTLESAKTKIVSASVSNVEIKKFYVEEGDEVTKGQKLVTFDEADLRESLSEAKENLADTKVQNSTELASANRKLAEAQETYSSQKKKYATSVADAKSEYQEAKKAVSSAKTAEGQQKAQETLSQAKKAYEQAKSEQESGNKQNKNNVQSAKEQVTSTKNSNKKSLREAERQVTDAADALEGCSVTAPMAGFVTAVEAKEGDTYNGGDLIEISDCTNLQVSTTVDEYDISNIEKGQRVVILTDATDEEELEGTITYVAKTTGSSLNSSSSGSAGTTGAGSSSMGSTSSGSASGYEVRIQVKKANDKLRIGMTAKCSIILKEASDVYAVPYDAVHTNTSGDTVLYVMDDNGMRSEVEVTKGMESDYYVEVSGDGLSENLQVIIPTDEPSTSTDTSESDSFDGLMGGGMKGGGNYNKGNRGNSSGGGPGGAPGGAPGM